jgi:carbamoylphosphate synthase large subunit
VLKDLDDQDRQCAALVSSTTWMMPAKVLADIGLPLIIRPAFTLGGTGGGITYNVEEFETIVSRAGWHPVSEVLIEESAIGWKNMRWR